MGSERCIRDRRNAASVDGLEVVNYCADNGSAGDNAGKRCGNATVKGLNGVYKGQGAKSNSGGAGKYGSADGGEGFSAVDESCGTEAGSF